MASNVFRDLDELLDPRLELVIGGKVYVVEPPNAELGLWCERVLQTGANLHAAERDEQVTEVMQRFGDAPPPGDNPDLPLQARVLGGTYQQMVDDGVAWPKVKFCGHTTFIWITMGEEAALAYWNAGGRPEQPAPNRAARRKTSPPTGAAPSTRKRGSMSTTTSPKTSNPAKAAAASRSTGGTSSPAGGSSKPTSTTRTASTSKTRR